MFRYLKAHWPGILYGVLLTGFTIYLVMDTFLISKVYRLAEQKETSGTYSNVTETSKTFYEDDQISIKLTEYREEDTTIYVADVVLSSPEYLKTAFAKNSYGKNVTEKTSEIAAEKNAILAINGDYYGAQEKGYVLRNGNLYRNEAEEGQEDLVIYQDGKFGIISEEDITAEELLEQGAQEILSFGPALIQDGAISVTEEEEVGRAMASNPRTAIGIIDDFIMCLLYQMDVLRKAKDYLFWNWQNLWIRLA